MSNPDPNEVYDAIRCRTCGRVWESHTADCPRHSHRPDPPWMGRARELRRSWEARQKEKEKGG